MHQRVEEILVIARIDISAMGEQAIDDILAPMHHRHL